MKLKIIKLLIGLLFSSIGFYLTYQFGGFELMVAMFFLFWGNNISEGSK